MSLRIAVLASGRGSNLRALFDAQQKGLLAARIVGVFSDRAGCDAIAFARRNELFTFTLRSRDFPSREAFDEALFSQIELVQPDLIVFAGYMRLVSQRAVQRFEGRMINIHPSLLPKYPGLDTHARALAAGDTEHGASVHVVTAEVDAGPVIAQARVPVLPDDDSESLAQRVLEREHPLLVQSVQAIADARLALTAARLRWCGTTLDFPLSLNAQDRLEERE